MQQIKLQTRWLSASKMHAAIVPHVGHIRPHSVTGYRDCDQKNIYPEYRRLLSTVILRFNSALSGTVTRETLPASVIATGTNRHCSTFTGYMKGTG